MIRRLSQIAGWALAAAIAVVTRCPVKQRPRITHDPQVERFAAFALIGAAFGVAYPHRRGAVTVALIAAAFGLEAVQILTPDRHGQLADALAKAAESGAGVFVASLPGRARSILAGLQG